MKEKNVILAVTAFIMVFIILLFTFLYLFFENSLYKPSDYRNLVHVDIDRTVEDLKVVKIAYPHPKSHPIHAALNEMLVPELKQVTESFFQVELYPDNQLGESYHQLEGLMNGAIELSVLPSVDLDSFDSMSVFTVPYLFHDFSEVDKFMSNQNNLLKITQELEESNLVLLGWSYDGYRHIVRTSSSFNPSDKTVGISSAIDSPLRSLYFQSLNYVPKYIDGGNLIGLIRSSAIPYGEISTAQYSVSGISHAVRNIESYRYLSVPAFFIANKEFWEDLSTQEKVLVQKAVHETTLYANDAVLASEEIFSNSFTLKNNMIAEPGNEYIFEVNKYMNNSDFEID